MLEAERRLEVGLICRWVQDLQTLYRRAPHVCFRTFLTGPHVGNTTGFSEPVQRTTSLAASDFGGPPEDA
jgi:hypothetical protein